MTPPRYPAARYRPLPENATQPLTVPTQVILHSAVSSANSLYAWFSSAGVVVESHLYVAQDGDTEQYIDFNRQADANYKANGRAISVETWDAASPDTVPWTVAQRDRLVDILVWCHRNLSIPLVTCGNPLAPGVGYHSQYNGAWTPSVKTCPGQARIPFVPHLLAAARAVVAGTVRQPVLPTEPQPKGPGGSYHLLVDGIFGPRTIMRLQESLNRTLGGADLRVDGSFGDRTQRRLQQRLGVTVDGIVGPTTIKVLQRNVHAPVDGAWGPATTRALQSALNHREL